MSDATALASYVYGDSNHPLLQPRPLRLIPDINMSAIREVAEVAQSTTESDVVSQQQTWCVLLAIVPS